MDTSSYHTQASYSRSSGRLRRYLLPPISVIIMGSLLALLLSQLQVDQGYTAPLPTEKALSQNLVKEEGISEIFTPEVQYWEEEILVWSKEHQLDPNLVATVMQIESCGYSRAKSAAGAMGLFQVMPSHFKKKDDPYEPDLNAAKGLKWLKQTLEATGKPRLALAGYNGGLTRARRPEEQWPRETKKYVYWGLKIYQDTRVEKERSNRLNEWLAAGGDRLCRQAATEQNGDFKK